MKHIGARMRDCFLFKDKANTLRSVMSRDSDNRRVDGEKRRELSSLLPFSGLDTPSSPLPPYSIAIFDTCALLHTKDILETAIKRNVIAVVPCTVLHELGKHASSERIKHMAYQVFRSINTFEKDPLFFTETPNVKNEDLDGIEISSADDSILKCALRVHQHMSHQKRTIWFVTNDKELQLKATESGASIIVIGAQKFMDDMKMKTNELSEGMMEADDLEKLRICLTQPKQTPESTAEKAETKLSTLTPKEEVEDKKKQPLQQSESKTEKAEKKPSTVTPEDKKEEEDKKKQPKLKLVRTAETNCTNMD